MKVKSNIGDSLINAFLFFLLGILLFTNPNGMVKSLIYIFGGVMILAGIFKILLYYKSNTERKEVVNGLAYLIFGMTIIICTLVFFDAVETVIRLVVSIFFLYMGINRLITSFSISRLQKPMYLINSFLLIIGAVALALIQGLGFKMLGLFIIGFSLVEMICYIFFKKEEEEVIKEATIVKVKEEK